MPPVSGHLQRGGAYARTWVALLGPLETNLVRGDNLTEPQPVLPPSRMTNRTGRVAQGVGVGVTKHTDPGAVYELLAWLLSSLSPSGELLTLPLARACARLKELANNVPKQ